MPVGLSILLIYVMEAKIITLSNFKWWVGKTSVTVNLAGIFAKNKKRRVLVIDLDQQCNATRTILWYEWFNQYANELNAGDLFDRNSKYDIHDLIVKKSEYLHIIPGKHNDLFLLEKELDTVHEEIWSVIPGLAKILASPDLESKRPDLENMLSELRRIQEDNKNWTKILKRRLSTVLDEYDYIIIDLPPSVSRIPVNAWVASEVLLIPVSDVYALDGTEGLLNRMVDIMKNYNEDLQFYFFFNKVPVGSNQHGSNITKHFQDIMTKLDKEIRLNVHLSKRAHIMDSYIRYSRDMDISNANSDSVVNVFQEQNKLVEDFTEFANELETILSK